VLDLVLEAEEFEDHGVGAVENQGEEKREAAEVHVTLRIELAGLDFHAVRSESGGSVARINCQQNSILRSIVSGERKKEPTP